MENDCTKFDIDRTQFDDVEEHYLSFQSDHWHPIPSFPMAQPGFNLADPDTLPVKTIVTTINKTFEELTPPERMRLQLDNYKITDKAALESLRPGGEAGPTESIATWTKRMGLKPTWILCKENPDTMDNHRHTRPDGECGMCFSVNHGETTGDLDDQAAHKPTRVPKNILDMSWPAQRSFRWNNPDDYAQWVEDLKEEMGVHFDESLVLPEYKFGDRPEKKPRPEYHPEDLDDFSEEQQLSSFLAAKPPTIGDVADIEEEAQKCASVPQCKRCANAATGQLDDGFRGVFCPNCYEIEEDFINRWNTIAYNNWEKNNSDDDTPEIFGFIDDQWAELKKKEEAEIASQPSKFGKDGFGICYYCDNDVPVEFIRNSCCPAHNPMGNTLSEKDNILWKEWCALENKRTNGRYTNPYKETWDSLDRERDSQPSTPNVTNEFGELTRYGRALMDGDL